MVTLFLFLLAIFAFLFYVILNVMEREKGGDIRTPAFLSLFLSVKLALFMVLEGTKRGGTSDRIAGNGGF